MLECRFIAILEAMEGDIKAFQAVAKQQRPHLNILELVQAQLKGQPCMQGVAVLL